MIHLGFVLLYVGLSLLLGWLGRDRRFGFWGYLFGSILLTPIIGMLLYLATDGPLRHPEADKPEKADP